MSSEVTAVLLIAGNPILAQVEFPSELWRVVAQSGFNAILVLVLLYLAHSKDEKYRRTLDLLTRAVTELTLSMAFLPEQFRNGASRIQVELDQINKK